MQLEDLLNKKKLYEGMKEILERVISSFSSINFNDDLLSAKNGLDSYFDINEDHVYASKLASEIDNINNNIIKLKEVLNTVNVELEEINNQIMSMGF